MTLLQFLQISITALAFTANLIFRYRDKRRKKLFYVIGNRTILENRLSDNKIVLTYNGEKTKKLLQTDILILNKSGQTIKYEELGKSLGLQIVFSETTNLYNLEIIEYNNPNVNLTCQQENNKIKLFFDYFKNENYVLLKFLSNENNIKKPELLGEFINNDRIVKFNLTRYKISEVKRAFPYILIGSVVLSIISTYFKFEEKTIYILVIIFGFVSIDILRKVLNKKIDRRIKDIVTE